MPVMGVTVAEHCRRKEIVSGGGGGWGEENFFERHYFLRLQKQFSEKWGHVPPAPRFLRHCRRGMNAFLTH